MKKTVLKYLALGGITGPVLFIAVTLICASLRPDYNHIHQFISELGATGTANALLMNWAGFIPAGLMIALFAVSLTQHLPNIFLGRLGSILILAFGIGMVIVGCLSCDPGCPRDGSLENNLHDQISGPTFLSAIAGMLILGISFRRLDLWRKVWRYSVLSAIVSLGFFFGLITSLESYTFTGIWQRLLILTIFVWMGIVGLHTYRSHKG